MLTVPSPSLLMTNCPWKGCGHCHVLIGSRQRAFRRAINETRALLLSPPNGGSKRNFLHLPFSFIYLLQVIVDISSLICGLNIVSPCLQMKTVPIMGVATWRNPLLTFRPFKIPLERLKLETSNLVYMFIIASQSVWTTNCPWQYPWKGCGQIKWTM